MRRHPPSSRQFWHWPALLRRAMRKRHKAAIGNRRNPVLCHIGQKIRLMRPRIKLDLIGIRQRYPRSTYLIQVGLVIIAAADCAGLADLLQVAQSLPLGDTLGSAILRMDQIEINILKTKTREAFVTLSDHLRAGLSHISPGRVARPEFRSHEKITPRQASRSQTCSDPFTHSLFVVMARRGVDMRISRSSFYSHFKLVTETTPLQYQKDLRMIAARDLLRAGRHGVWSASFEVGYESPAHFCRDYNGKFGLLPSKEASVAMEYA